MINPHRSVNQRWKMINSDVIGDHCLHFNVFNRTPMAE